MEGTPIQQENLTDFEAGIRHYKNILMEQSLNVEGPSEIINDMARFTYEEFKKAPSRWSEFMNFIKNEFSPELAQLIYTAVIKIARSN